LPQSGVLRHHPAEDRILALLKGVHDSEILFHHRFPTSTANVKNACHPFSTGMFFGDREFVMVHNGWLTNQHLLKFEHGKLGIDYASTQPDGRFNDSEALLYDLALTITGRQTESKAKGAVAFIMIERVAGEPVRLHFGRNSSPLNLKRSEHGLGLSSEGAGEPITPQTHYTYDYATNQITQEPMKLMSGYEWTGGGYKGWAGHSTDNDDGSYSYHPKVAGGRKTPPSTIPGYITSGVSADSGPAPAVSIPTLGLASVTGSTSYGQVLLPNGDDALDTAGELFIQFKDYDTALSVARNRQRNAERRVVQIGDIEEEYNLTGSQTLINEQLEQIQLAEHYDEVCDLLAKWQSRDETFTNQPRSAHVQQTT
jgi:hypothetical protein